MQILHEDLAYLDFEVLLLDRSYLDSVHSAKQVRPLILDPNDRERQSGM